MFQSSGHNAARHNSPGPAKHNTMQNWNNQGRHPERAAAVLMLALAAAAVSGCGEGADPVPEAPITDTAQLLELGRKKARVCTSCHGANGISQIASYPSLAGLPQEYLSEQLHEFRGGTRQNPTMSSIAINLSDNDIAALSTYFASLPPAEESAP